MRKQKKFFLSWVLGFLLLILFFPQSNLLADDADETLNAPTTKESQKIVDDDDNVSNETDTSSTSGGGPACESTTSEGLEGGFLFFKGSVVPCGRSCDVAETEEDESASCTLCHFILLAKNIYDLLFAMVIFASILMITIGGTVYMISSGSRNLAGAGKALITKTLAGFALFILGELIVITVLNFVGANLGVINKSGSFFKFTCDTESAFDRVTEYTYSKPDQFQSYSSAGCPTSSELKTGFDGGITEYCKPKESDFSNEEDFLCAMALNCSCPAGNVSEKECKSSTMSWARCKVRKDFNSDEEYFCAAAKKESCPSGTAEEKTCGSGSDKWAPCNSFSDDDIVYCNKTASGAAPQSNHTVAADTSCGGLKLGAKVSICGKTYAVEDTGSAIKGKRFDVFIDDCNQAKSYTCEVKGL